MQDRPIAPETSSAILRLPNRPDTHVLLKLARKMLKTVMRSRLCPTSIFSLKVRCRGLHYQNQHLVERR